ncbi:ATP synthase subunit delta [Philodulcilactobacillus myokoensis]|uniref:ATP synthase subunit delta n=1 Tax=Philodulcilactobacillus myokoensis TaxID=2929573 RepID=A0A9W6ETK4_9LACO|nr:ATP synthase F1 subunit delta [Philodulcilactobacillus myokoensis]GLB47079.1 ATP synthase subunit delta [Philodulcilactobacillus myokoensis]
MIDKITVAKRYSKAIFELFNADNKLDEGYQELNQLKTIFDQNPKLVSLLSSVSYPTNDKNKLISALVDGTSSKYVKNLIQMTCDYGRISDIPAIVDQFNHQYDEAKSIVHADVISAIKLDQDELDHLSNAFAKRVGANKVIFNTKVDQSIIGGIIIKSSNIIFDGSVRTKINRVRQLLLN